MEVKIIAGIDEAGRGPLAGPVVAAVVILNPRKRIRGLDDSKKLTPKQRDELYPQIVNKCLDYAIARAEVEEIDKYNIHQATMLAMQRAFSLLSITPMLVLVDGKCVPKLKIRADGIVHGDQKIAAISAASILAKVTRDQLMVEADKIYPGYGFAKHKGYGTLQHQEAIKKLGVSPIHRRSFEPIKTITKNTESKGIFNQELDLIIP